MSRFTAWIALLILIGSVWSQEQFSKEEFEERSPRFGFDLLDPIRKSICNYSCGSSETSPYLTNLACALKCPELYLPHGTASTMKSTEKPSTSMSTTPSTSSSTSTTPSTSSSTSSTSLSSSTSPSVQTSPSSSTSAASTSASSTAPASSSPSP